MWKKTKFVWKLLFRLGFKKGAKEGLSRGYKKGKISFVNLESDYYREINQHCFEVLQYAIKVNSKSFDKYNSPNESRDHKGLANDAYFRISTRAIELYRSIIVLCESGWASTTPILLRSLLECFNICAVITKKDSDYMAFRYFVHDYLGDLHKTSSKELGGDEHNRTQIHETKEELNADDKKKADRYIKDFLDNKRSEIYWYRPDYSSVDDIIEKCCTETSREDIKFIWRILCKASHVSHVGSNLFKDKPDKYEIKPREDRKGVVLALSAITMLLLDLTTLRAEVEGLGAFEERNELRLERESLKKKYSYEMVM